MTGIITRLPTLFISHGGPNILQSVNKSLAKEKWRDLLFVASGAKTKDQVLQRVKAIVVISAHWTSDSAVDPRITITDGKAQKQIYDFYGFPDELYRIEFHAQGDDRLANRIKNMIDTNLGTRSILDSSRGIDHGTWVPLVFAMKEQDLMQIPVVQVSLLAHSNQDRDSAKEVSKHIALGRALASLRDEGILVIGSGSETHNLKLVFSRGMKVDFNNPYALQASDYVVQFVQYLKDGLMPARDGGDSSAADGLVDTVVHYRERTPHGKTAHPTQEHYLPLAVALGAALPMTGDTSNAKVRTERLFDATEYGDLSMGIFAFH